jgi:hypothetical protein
VRIASIPKMCTRPFVLSLSLEEGIPQMVASPPSRRGDKIKRNVVVSRLTFFRCRAAFN